MTQQQLETQPFHLYFAFHRTSTNTDDYQGTFHAHQGVEILIIHQGKGTIIVDQNSYEIQPGMVCIFQPYQLHHIQIEINEEAPFIRSILHYEPTLFEAYFDKWPLLLSFFEYIHNGTLASPRCFKQEELRVLISLLEQLDETLSSVEKINYQEEISLSLVLFFRTLKPLWEIPISTTAKEQPLRKPHQAENIMQWLQQHYHKPFRLEQLSKDLHLSTYHLSHLFKECTGSSITDYLTALRLQKAVHLLTSTEYSIAFIAERVGIPNCSHFCKQFKKQFNTTPNQFRKQWNKHQLSATM